MSVAVANHARFAAQHPDVAAWLDAAPQSFHFAVSLASQVYAKGTLSDRQIEAARRCIANSAAAAQRVAQAPEAELPLLEQAFAKARESGLQRPKMTITGFRFSPAGETSRNPGAIYAKDRESGTYLGKFAAGRFVRSRDCDELTQAKLISIAKDPLAHAIAHGKLTGSCAICSRKLTDPESVERGIGPICSEKYGW